MSENEQNSNVIELPISITVRELAEVLGTSPIDVIKNLMANGVMANINQEIDYDTAAIVSAEMGFEPTPQQVAEEKPEQMGEIPLWRQKLAEEDEEQLAPRPPVVSMLGHVDHGKTSLLDVIRHTSVASGEAGGITQHIGAYQAVHNGNPITFLDTPGHAAFTSMRARGAQGADIVVLVVAADDGVMPQTKEAISHARAAQVPMVVALNKIDKDNAVPEQVKQQLAEEGLVPDDWDGDTLVIPLSATENEGIEDLLEAILLIAGDMDIMANPSGEVFGTVIESEITKRQGVMATLLVQNGTLEVSDTVLANLAYGRIKAMFDFHGESIKEAGPSVPVSVMGLNEAPTAGDLFEIVKDEKEARRLVEERELDAERKASEASQALTLEELFARAQIGDVENLSLVIKADVQGSLEPIVASLEDMKSEGEQEIGVEIIHTGIGRITENDIMLASTSDAIVIGFNVGPDKVAKRMAEREGISIRRYKIIYHLINDVQKALQGMLDPVEKKILIGRAEVLAVFPSGKFDQVAGCRVQTGEIRRNALIRVVRDAKVIYEGEISSLKRHQEDVNEVRKGFECGIGLRGFSEFEEGDKLESYVIEEVTEF
ncbi:MAG: Translation initiation factor IF-2 [Chloroflexi bacterium]|nr:Translation initiation factor IF-2 [Chloroflexota bacterium]